MNLPLSSSRSRPWPAWLVNLSIALLIAALWPINGLADEWLRPDLTLLLVFIGINIILATSLNLINGLAGQFSLGHAGFMVLGAYTTGVLLRHYHPAGALTEPLSFLGLLILGGLLAAVAGLAVGLPTLRLRGDYLAIATLGFGEIIYIIISMTDKLGPFVVGGSSGLHRIPIQTNLFWTCGWVIVCVVCMWRIASSAKGKAFLAIREDETAAAAMGIDVTFHKVAAFVIGAFFAGIAGGLAASNTGNLDPEEFRFMRSIEIVVMVVLGGSGSITGSILAAVVLTWLMQWLRNVKEWTGGDISLIIYSVLLIVMMLLRPEGLLGRRELWWTRRRVRA